MSTESPRVPTVFAQALAGLALVGWLLLAVCCVLAPAGAYVGSDAGYYLPLADGMAHGRIPLLDVPLHYTPFGIFIMGAPGLFSATPSYESHVAVQIIVVLLGALAAARLARLLGTTRTSAALASGLYAFCGLYFEGSTALEPFVSLFILIGLVLAFEKALDRVDALRWVAVGFAASVAVLCKQQAIFLVLGLLFVVGVFASPENRLKRLALTCAGGAIGLGILVALIASSKLGTSATIANLTWSGRSYAGSQLTAGFAMIVSLFVLKASPVLLGAPLVSRRALLAFGAATCAACVPALLKPYPHYLSLALAFSAPLAALVLDALAQSPGAVLPKRFFLVAVVVFWGLQVGRLALRYRGPEANLVQLRQEGAALHAAIGSQRVLQLAAPALNYFGDLTPSAVDYAGYMFSGYFTLAEAESKLLPQTDVIVAERGATEFDFIDGKFAFSRLPSMGFCPAPPPIERISYWQRCTPAP